VFGEKCNPHIFVDFSITNAPTSVYRNAKTLELQHLQLPDMSAGSEPPDRACILYSRTDVLLKKERTVSRGQATFPFKKGTPKPSFWAVFHPTWMTRAEQVSSVWRVTASYTAVSTQYIGYSINWPDLGCWVCLAVLANTIALVAVHQSLSHYSLLPWRVSTLQTGS
jgi:hypothetical protein